MAYRDRTQAALLRDIGEYRIQSFKAYSKTMSVHPHKEAKEVEHLGIQRWVGFNLYNFDQHSKPSKPIYVEFYIEKGRDEVNIRYRKRWTKVSTYMKHVSPVAEYYGPEDGLLIEWQKCQSAKQAEWWCKNQQVFRLLDLPKEVRYVVYEYALGSPIEPYPDTRGRRIGMQGTAMMKARQPNINLLRTNQQICSEARNVFYLYTPVIIEYKGVITRVIQNEVFWPNIRRLELSLPMSGYFSLFGFGANGKHICKDNGMAKCLRKMRLSRLTLWFPRPRRFDRFEFLDGACHKVVVDWIIEAAWLYIKGHPLAFKGCLKNSQNRAFETWATVERHKFKLWNDRRHEVGTEYGTLEDYDEDVEAHDLCGGGVRLDGRPIETWWEEEVKRMKDDWKELPPTCSCTYHCLEEEWTAD